MSGLADLLREEIAEHGPMTVARYMQLAIAHPSLGYYASRDPFGPAGDFITAPEISQMFGELLGLWAAEVWAAMGRPRRIAWIELGPGRGTLMADALRAARVVPDLQAAISVHLVETSPTLRERQKAALAGSGYNLTWHAALSEVPDGPAIVLANEFLDALPIRQFVRAETGWRERLVGLGEAGEVAFGLAPDPAPQLGSVPGRPGEVLEIGEAALAVTAEIGRRLRACGGAALLIDYGHDRHGLGDTLQAVRAHRFADPLENPGNADLTAHVDFAALAEAARRTGVGVHGPVAQAVFLEALGIETRATRLAARAGPAGRQAIDAALRRLCDRSPTGMGRLFKVLGLADPALPGLPGLPRGEIRASRPAPAAPVGNSVETLC